MHPSCQTLGVMKHAWYWLKLCVTKDDLFLRVLFFLFGTAIGGGGMYGVYWLTAHGMPEEPLWLQVFLWVLAVFFAAWGSLLLMRSFVRSDSRIAQLAEKGVPDSADEGALVLVIVFCLPAVFLTILLRLIGVRGEALASRL